MSEQKYIAGLERVQDELRSRMDDYRQRAEQAEAEVKRLEGVEQELVRMREVRDDEAQRASDFEAEVLRLREALMPSGQTKAAYMCEFSVPLPDLDEYGIAVMRHINVPWVTIKQIMATIAARAKGEV